MERIGILPRFTQHDQEIAMRLREHKVSWSGDDFTVKDAVTQGPLFRIDGAAFSLRGSKSVKDVEGKALFTVRGKFLNIPPKYEAIDPASGQVLLEVSSPLVSFSSKLKARFRNVAGNGNEMELQLRGDFLARKADITTADGRVVAKIERTARLGAANLLFDKQTYIVTVQPFVDISLIVALCVCLDERYKDQNK